MRIWPRSLNERLSRRFDRDRFLLGTALVPVAALAGTGSALGQAVNLGHNSIVPDGRTATTVRVHGSVTNIRTSTFAGGNAYNSFSTFSEAAGNTVNLRVPKQANSLVNIVRNGAVNIQGTLNSYKSGKIGGNIVFADSYGFVVGRGGVVNTGSLTVITPSGATLDQLIDGKGHVNQALAAQMLAGNVPLSADGSVVIQGRINAAHLVRISAQDVRVAGSMAEAKRAALHRAQFEATVNTSGMREGGSIVVRNGSISIVAANNASIGGTLSAGGRTGGTVAVAAAHNVKIATAAHLSVGMAAAYTAHTGTAHTGITHTGAHSPGSHTPGSRAPGSKTASAAAITISAGNDATIAGLLSAASDDSGPGEIAITGKDIAVSATAKLVAEGTGTADGGHISIKSTGTTSVASGATFLADARGSGNGGLVEISGKVDTVAAGVIVNLGAASGTAGTLLFDPDQLIIGGATQTPAPGDNPIVGGSTSTLASLYTDGGSVELDATTSITIDGIIDTRKYSGDQVSATQVAGTLASVGKASTGNSGAITLDAPSITVASGGALYADIYNATTNGTTTAWTPGAIALGAAGTGQTITINGTVAGGAITVTAPGTMAAPGMISVAGSVVGGPTVFSAGSQIALAATGVVDTRSLDPTGTFSIADSQSIALTAPTITIAGGGQIRAGTLNTASTTYAAGAITLDASTLSTGSIDLAGTTSGGTTTFLAGASITLESSAAVDTRALDPTGTVSTVDTQNVSLTAPTINAKGGSQIDASVVNTADTGFLPGTISFDATGAANGTVTAAGSLAAGNVALAAGSTITLGATSTISTPNTSDSSTGAVTLSAPTIIVTGGAAISALNVDYELQRAAVIIGDPTADSTDAGAAGFLSNAAITTYAAALGGSGTMQLTALDSITLDPHAMINLGVALALGAPTITLSGGSTLGGGSVTLSAPTISIDAATTGGSHITAQSLTLATSTLNLTSTPDVVVGDALQDSNKTVAGFISNETIASYVAAMAGSGLLQVSGTSSITLDASGVIDTRQIASGISAGNSLSIALQAPSITLATGSAIRAEAINANGSTFIPGAVELTASTGLTVNGSVSGGEIFVASPSITTASSVFTAALVDFIPGATDVAVNGVGAGALTNATVAGYVASLSGTTGFELSAANSITVAAGGSINTGTKALTLSAPILTLAAGSSVSGGALGLTAGPTGVINIDADSKGGAAVSATSLQFQAAMLNLPTTAQTLTVGDQTETVAASVAGFVSSQTIQTYVAAMDGTGTLTLTAPSAIIVDATGAVDTRQIAGGASTGNSLNVALLAPTVTIAAGGQVLGQAINATGTSYTGGNVVVSASGIDVAGTIKGANIALAASTKAITLETTASIDARQLDASGTITGPAFDIALQAPSISVASGANLHGSTVAFAFTESGLTLSGSATGQTGTGGVLSNDTVAAYIAAMKGTGTFVLEDASGTLTLAAGSMIDGTSNGGAVGVELSSAGLAVNPQAQINAGVVSIAPTSNAVVIGDASDANANLTNQTIAQVIQATGGLAQEISISASGSITLDATAIIDTRELGSGGTSVIKPLDVALSAPTITMDKGAQILAQAVNDTNAPSPFVGGAVTLTANSSDYKAIGAASATAAIFLDGTINAASIAANATATAESVYALNANNTSPGNLATVLVGSLLTDLLPFALQPGYVQASATASVAVGADAVLKATGNVALNARSVGVASDPAIGLSTSGALFAAGVVVGQLNQSATATIASGATIKATSLDVAATNSATLDVQTEQVSGPTVKGYGADNRAPAIQIDFAYGEASIDSAATIASGAMIDVSGAGSAVDLLARNDNSFTSSATSDALTGGKVGAAIAIGDFNSSAIAHEGASIGTSIASVGSVSVVAQSETSKDKVAASSTVGSGKYSELLAGIGVVGSAVSEGASGSVTPPTLSLLGGVAKNYSKLQSSIAFLNKYLPQVAGAVSVSLGTQTSAADISADGGGAAPTIHASGGVAVISDTTDSGLVTGAQSSVNAAAPSPGNPAVYVTVSAAVAITFDTQNSSAVIGPGVTIDAGQIGVDATSSIPVPIENIDWTDPTSVLEAITGNAGLFTTNAKASSDSSNLGISGAVDYLSLTNNTTAWVGTGATLTTTGGDTSWTTANLQSLDPSAKTIQTTFTASQSVLASTTVETLNIPGDFLALQLTNSNGGVSVGGTLGLAYDTNTTIAGIAAGAMIDSAGTVDVDAETSDRSFSVTPTAGSGTGVNFSGIAFVDLVGDTTSASISNDATVAATAVDVNAHQDLGIYTFTGDITLGGASSVGISVAYAGLTTQTAAFIGDNSGVVGVAIDPQAGTDRTVGSVSADTVDVTAKTTGNDVVGAIAAQNASGNPSPSPGGLPGGSRAIVLSGIAQKAGASTITLSISGSAAYTDTALTTAAYIEDAVINGVGTSPSVSVTAISNTLTAVGSGAAALASGGAKTTLVVAVAAAAAFDSNSDATLAYIESSKLVGVSSVSVEAQSTGLIADVGLGIAVARPSGKTAAGGFAGSASGALVADRVSAFIDNSTITGSTSAPGNLVVLADQQTTIGVGGGSFFFGGQGGGGLALTYTDIADPSSGPAADAHISNSSVTSFTNIAVVAEAPQAIYSAAAEATSSGVGLGGALVFTTDTSSISATISNSGGTPLPIDALDDVTVIAVTDPKYLPSFVTAPTITSSASGAGSASANFADPSGDTSSSNAADAALLTSGSAAILSIAGNVVVGGSNGLGVSSVDDTIGVAHTASISGVTVTAPGALTVSALDSTAILAIGIGLGDSTALTVQAGLVLDTITSSTTALIGPAIGATSTAATKAIVGGATVEAIDSSVISAFALVAAKSGTNASVGISVATSTIDTPATAAINNATVTTAGAFTPAGDATGDIVLQGLSTAEINTVAVGVAASNQLGIAGSAVASLEESDVTAEILSSTVFAANNVGVLASNDNTIDAIAGALAATYPPGSSAVGVSVTVSQITGSTTALITSSTVDAQALGTGSLVIVDGALSPGSTASAAAADNPSNAVTPGSLPDLGADVRSDHGLAVVAGSQQTATAFAVTAGISKGATLVINSVNTEMGGKTAATISNSSLDTQPTTSASSPAIDVAAYSVSYANELVLNLALSTSSGYAGAAAAATDKFDRTTEAYVLDTTIGAPVSATSTAIPAGAVTIDANAYEGASTVLVGLSIGGAGAITGNLLVNLFDADTEASLRGGTVNAASLNVTATGTNGYFAAVGSGAGGESGADADAIAVSTFGDTTSATIGDATGKIATTLNLSGPLTVQATSAIDVTSYVLGFSGAGIIGAAAQISVDELSDTTIAALYNTTATIAPTAADGAVNVTATDNVSLDTIVGAASVGGAGGLGASANVVVLSSANTAEMVGDTVTTPGSVSVQATEARDVSLITATAALSGTISVAATVGVILIGPEAGSDATDAVRGSLGAGGAASGISLAKLGTSLDGDSAAIIGGSVTASGVTIDATGNLATSNVVGSLAVGLGAAGVGASVGYTEIDQAVSASAIGGTITTNSLSIAANAGDDGSGHAVNSIVFAGAGGLFVGIAGALAFSNDSDVLTAELSSTVNAGQGSVTANNVVSTFNLPADSVSVTASDTSTVWANAYGGAVGLAAAGVSVATADRDSSVTAEIATLAATPNSAATTATIVADTVTVRASDAGDTYAYALAGAAGGEAGAGAAATATDNSTVLASVIGASTIIAPVGGLTVQATDTPDAKAFTFGVAVGAGDAVGASVSDAEVTASVTANVDGAVILADTDGITNGVSILASTLIDGSPASSFPSSSTVPGTTGEFQQGGTTAAAWAITGVGSLFLAANGTVSIANDTATVSATGGSASTLLALPAGNIAVDASNTSDVFAQGTGVAVSGLAAVGAVVVTASASPTTAAELDASTTFYQTAAGSTVALLTSVNVTATGTDTLNAVAMAGSGGLLAGDGSSAATSDTSKVTATIGASSFIEAVSIDVAASHTDNFSEMADSINAGLVGASAALSTHDASSKVGVIIGDNATLYATASGLTPCLGGCTPALDITATNSFQDSNSGTSAGAGGGINGAGATSTITIDNNGEGSTISVGAGAILSSGFDPINDPGSLAIVASTTVTINDTDNLTTGGLIEGAGVSADVRGQLNNTVTIGAGAALTTYGVLDIATYTTAFVNANAYVSTYGVAGVGEAYAYIDLTGNQTITVAASASPTMPTIINASSNVNITAGDYIDGGYATIFSADTNAESYVRGLIAVPGADAHTSIPSNATVDLALTPVGGSQTSIGSGENVTINADPGTPTLASDGTGHGYELGFIPVTNGSNYTSAPPTSVVTVGAAVVAGEYHDQEVTINANLTVSETSGAPLAYASTPTFDILTFLNDDFTGPGSFGNLVSTSAVPTVSLGALYASGGLVRIQATTLQGNGSLTAYGAPTINVTDNFPIYLILAGGALIPNTPGGSVVFTGSAGKSTAQNAGIAVDENNATGTPSITITLTYGASGGVGNSSAGPGLFNTAALTNVGGLIHIVNDYGSFGSAGTIVNPDGQKVPVNTNVTADSSIVYEPNGAYVFQADDASGNYIAGGSAYSEWASAIVYPGGTPSTAVNSPPDANAAIQYVATAIYERGTYNGDNFTDAGGNSYNLSPGAVSTDGGASNINQALYGHAGNTQPNNKALVLVGACIQALGSASCQGSGGYLISDTNGQFGDNQFPNYSVQTLNYSFAATGNANTANNESTGGSAASQQVYGSYVAITAATIDVNGSITVGKSTSYTADVSTTIGQALGDLHTAYQDLFSENFLGYIRAENAFAQDAKVAGLTPAQIATVNSSTFGSIDVTPFLSSSAASASLGVGATYSAITNQITFGNISTFSAGASVKLDGAIVSTNTLGNIHVNSGYGNVSITNETGIALNFGDINTGAVGSATAGTSTVTIINRLIDQVNDINNPNNFYLQNPSGFFVQNPNYLAYQYQNDTTTYIYNPASGITAYLSSNGASPVGANGNLINGATLITLPSGSTSSSTTYQTVIGAEFEFVQEALLTRTVTAGPYGKDFLSASGWTFASGTLSESANDPWYYVNPGYISSLTQNSSAPSNETSSTPVGQVIISTNVKNGVNPDPAFQETITGNTTGAGFFQGVNYSQGGFVTQPEGSVIYGYFYPTAAFLRLTTTVKADNPFGVSFGGNAQGSLGITSSGAVILNGTITNPTGRAYISALGAVTQTPTASLTSNSLDVFGQVGIGTPTTPLNVTLSPGLGTTVGSLVATSEVGNVDINLNSGANGFAVGTTYGYGGTVVVHAAGSLQSDGVDGLDVGLSAVGNNITISTTNGSIGSASSPLSLVSPYDPFVPTGHYGNVTANISASGDIGLTVPYGSLLVGQITSTANGNITINVPNGNIYAAVSQTPASSLTSAQVTSIVSALNLVGGTGGDAAAGASAITGFQTLVDSDLTTYATFLAGGTVSTTGSVTIDSTTGALFSTLATSQAVQAARANPTSTATTQYTAPTTAQIQSAVDTLSTANGVFTLNINGSNLAGYQTQTAAALGITVAGFLPQAITALGPKATSVQLQAYATNLYNTAVANITTTQIQAWADSQYQAYATTFTQAYGSGWASSVTAAAATSNYSYTVAQGSPLAATLTSGASWTAQQLVDAIDVSALKPAAGNVGSSATANITGNNVTLNIGGSVGTYDPNGVAISLNDLKSDTLTAQQQAAIAVATTPGSVVLVGTLANGQPLPAGAQIGALPAGATVTGVNLPQEAPIFVNAEGAFTITSGGAVYLQGTSNSSVTLNTLSAKAPVDVTAPGSILSAGTGATNITTVGNIALIAGDGSIGTSTAPIILQTIGALTNASAGTNVYLDVVNGNAEIQRVFAGGTSTASITTGSGYSILSNLSGINIEAQNIVLNSGADIGANGTPLDVLATGTLTGSALGSAYIDATTVPGSATPNNLTVGNFSVGGNVYTGNNLFLEADGALTIAPGTLFPLSDITIKALGSLSLTAATLVMDQGSGLDSNFGTIAITTAGNATIGDMSVSVLPTQVSVISTGGSIFSNSDGIQIGGAADLSLAAAVGIGSAAAPLHIVSIQNLTASVTGTTGSIQIADDSALDVLSISAPTSISLTAASLTLPAISSRTITLNSAGAITFPSLTATAGDIDVTGGSIAGTSVTASSAATLTSTGADGALPSIDVTTVGAGTTIGATAQGGGILLGSATSGGTQTIEAATTLAYTALKTTSGDIDLTSSGSISGSGPSNMLEAAGSFDLEGATTITVNALTADTGTGTVNTGGAITLATVSTPDGALGIHSTGSSVTIGSATSGGTQTIGAATTQAYTTLKTTAGDIDLTSAGSIAGTSTGSGSTLVTDSLEAKGAFDLQGGTTVSATLLTADMGTGTVDTAGAVTLTAVSTPDGTLGITSTGAGVTIGAATSGGTQTINADTTLAYTMLKTTSGDIDLTSAGSIAGTSIGSGLTLVTDSLEAKGSFDLQGVTTISGTLLTADTGIGTVSTGGAVMLGTVSTPHGTLGVTSTGSSVTIGSATSGGPQTIGAATTLAYTTLKTTAGDIDLTSAGSIAGSAPGDTLDAKGSFDLQGGTMISATLLTADTGTGTVNTAGAVMLGTVMTPGGALGITSASASVTLGSATSGGTQTIGAKTAVDFTTLTATAGNIDVIGAAVAGTTLTATTGAAQLTSSGVDVASIPSIDVATISTGTTFGATAQAGGVTIGSATSGGTQTINADTTLAYATLKTTAGNIELTSAGSIAGSAPGDSLEAKGSFDLQGGTTISATLLTADTGTGTVNTGGAVTLGTVSTPDNTLGVTSTGGSVTIGSATSGGTQTIEAYGALSYTNLMAYGIAANPLLGIVADVGDIKLTSDTSSITGSASNDTLHAAGSFDLEANGINGAITATLLTADTGSGTAKALGAVTLATVSTPDGTLGVTSTGGSVTIGSATSGGTQTVGAQTTLAYTTLKTTAGDIDLTSAGSIAGSALGDTLDAKGSFDLQGGTTISGTLLTADTGHRDGRTRRVR